MHGNILLTRKHPEDSREVPWNSLPGASEAARRRERDPEAPSQGSHQREISHDSASQREDRAHYAGAPAQVEILEGTGVTDQATAAAMLPVGLSGVQRKIVTRLSGYPNPPSQAQLARDMGKSRTTVNSAIGILRKRGIVNQGSSLWPRTWTG